MTALEQELKYFAENKAKWMDIYAGKFVLVKGRQLIGVFDQAETALAEGGRLFGTESFLIRRVDCSDEDIYIPALALGLLHGNPA